jgi:SCP-2 sterol transfer family
VILFDIGDKKWTLDLSTGNGSIKEGESPDEEADVILTMSGKLKIFVLLSLYHEG